MRFDLPTLTALSNCLREHLSGRQIVHVERGTTGLQLSFGDDRFLRLTYRLPATLGLVAGSVGDKSDLPLSRADRFLVGAEFVEAKAAQRDRVLWLRLQRPDKEGTPTFGRLTIELIPTRFRAVLSSEVRGHSLGIWQSQDDPRSSIVGTEYREPTSDRLIPGHDKIDGILDGWEAEETLKRWLTRRLAGASRSLVGLLCERSVLRPEMMVRDVSDAQFRQLWEAARQVYATEGPQCWSWYHGDIRQISIVEPAAATDPRPHANLIDAFTQPEKRTSDLHLRMQKVGKHLQRRARRLEQSVTAMRQDLEQALEAEQCEHRGSLLLAAASQITPGSRVVELPDPYAVTGTTLRYELAPGQSAAQAASGLLKLGQKYRRRTQILPEKLQQSEAQLAQIVDLLNRVEGDSMDLTEEELTSLENDIPDNDRRRRRATDMADERQGARPRRYRTSSGWTVWAGRNNQENDTLTHRLAAQNDFWFHAHGYAGSHVLLRRDGRKQEPDARTLEEAAAVAAYWSKGRTANKVPVVYTLAKYVSKPRGAPAGLAVMKREKTVMVRPELLPEHDDA